MEWKEYYRAIYKRMWIIIVFTVIAVLLSIIVSRFLLDKVYESSVTLIVSGRKNASGTVDISYDEIMVHQKLVKTYGIIAKSDRVLQQVIRDLKLKTEVEQLRSSISVSGVEETEIIRITVEESSPKAVQEIANALAHEFQNQVKEILKLDNVQVIDEARIPDKAIRPRMTLNMILAFFTGLMAGLGVIFLMVYLDNTFKDAEDVQKYLDLPVIGSIPAFVLERSDDKHGHIFKTHQ